MIDKLKKIFTGKKKTENIIVLIVILIITVVAINYILSGDDKKNDEISKDEIQSNDVMQVNTPITDDIENKLEKILGKISGVGNVNVMITYSESSIFKPIYNEDSKISNTIENDSNGGTRSITESDSQKEVIYKENVDGTKEPATQSIVSPKVEGAIITAEGADNADVKANIIQAVEAATGLATHKIQVFKMN